MCVSFVDGLFFLVVHCFLLFFFLGGGGDILVGFFVIAWVAFLLVYGIIL